MTWIRTIPLPEADEKLRRAIEAQRALYPQEYATPVQPTAHPANSNGKPVSYGFGWFLDSYQGHKRMSHNGETIGFLTTIQRFVRDDLTVIVLANRSDKNPEQQALKVADLFLNH